MLVMNTEVSMIDEVTYEASHAHNDTQPVSSQIAKLRHGGDGHAKRYDKTLGIIDEKTHWKGAEWRPT